MNSVVEKRNEQNPEDKTILTEVMSKEIKMLNVKMRRMDSRVCSYGSERMVEVNWFEPWTWGVKDDFNTIVLEKEKGE